MRILKTSTSDALHSYDIERIKKNVEVFLYDYHTGDYQGYGQAIFLNDGKWYEHNLGHCSCYGPMDEISWSSETFFESLDEMRERVTPDKMEELAPLFDLWEIERPEPEPEIEQEDEYRRLDL